MYNISFDGHFLGLNAVMGLRVQLSLRSQELIQQYQEASFCIFLQKNDLITSVDIHTLVLWLSQELENQWEQTQKTKEELEFLLASLRAELLKDLNLALNSRNCKQREKEIPHWSAKVKFILLAIAGMLVAGCEGFDSMTTLLSFFSLPAVMTLLAGLGFAALSIIVFYGFNLVQVSMNLGIKLSDAPKLLDVYLSQQEEIKAIRRELECRLIGERSLIELAEIQNLVEMLNKRFDSLVKASKQFDEAVNSRKILIAKHIFSGLAGLLFFASGFFSGQSVALFIFGMIISSITPASWPVIVFSLLIGLASFSLYWYVERVGLNQLISGWFGLDEEKIELLCDESQLIKEEEKLTHLKERTLSLIGLKQKLLGLEEEVSTYQKITHTTSPDQYQLTYNAYSFYSKAEASSPRKLLQENLVPQELEKQHNCTL